MLRIGKQQPFFLVGVLLLMLATPISVMANILDQDCVVNVLNRIVQVGADGSWTMPNVPSSMGQIRARVTCVRNGVTTAGQTDYFTVQTNGITNAGNVVFGSTEPVPESLDITPVYGELLLKQLQVTDKGHDSGISSGNC